MRITVDLSPAVHHHAGLGRYAHELLSALCRVDTADEFHGFYYARRGSERPDPPLDRLPSHVIRMSAKPWRLSVLLAYYAGLAMDSRLPPSDIFHATDHLLPPLRHSKTVFTIHDLIFRFYPEYHLPLNRWFLTLMLPKFLRRADAVIAVSENTRRDVARWTDVPAERVTVVYEGVSPAFHPISDPHLKGNVRAKYELPERFLLYLGTIEPRKNLVTLLEAFRGLLASDASVPDLVIAGGKGWLYQPVFDRVRSLGLEKQVHFPGRIPEADAPYLMNAAEIFVFPSFYEGFGLPPLEAMACGVPVVCSNASSLPEVVGDAAEVFDPADVKGLVQSISRLLTDPQRRCDLAARGMRQASKFSWERAARETVEVYRRVGL